jgi:hypothetical protein
MGAKYEPPSEPFEEFRNINIQADLVQIGPTLAVRVHAAADIQIGSGWQRFSSEQHVNLDNFLAGLREKATPAGQAAAILEPEKA